MKIPNGYQTIMPYIIIKDAAKFIEFMKTVFAAEEKLRVARSENVIMHAEVSVGGCTMMLADATEEYQSRPGGFFVYVENADETYKIALENGAISVSPPSNQEYGRSCGIKDPFGNSWWPTSVIE